MVEEKKSSFSASDALQIIRPDFETLKELVPQVRTYFEQYETNRFSIQKRYEYFEGREVWGNQIHYNYLVLLINGIGDNSVLRIGIQYDNGWRSECDFYAINLDEITGGNSWVIKNELQDWFVTSECGGKPYYYGDSLLIPQHWTLLEHHLSVGGDVYIENGSDNPYDYICSGRVHQVELPVFFED